MKTCVAVVLFLAGCFLSNPARASLIVGNFSIAGADTFDQSSVTFTNPAYVISSTLPGLTGLLATPPNVQPVYLTSFLYADAPGTLLFTTTQGGVTVSFTISSDPGAVTVTYVPATSSDSASLKIQGYGTITDTGYDPTPGAFSLTSSTTGATSFQLVGDSPDGPSVVSEPSSLLMAGTGLLCVVGMLRRRLPSA